MKTLLLSTALVLSLMPLAARADDSNLTIVWADDSSSDVLFDPRVTQSRHEEQVIVQVFDQLVAADADGSFHPGLAKSWTIAPDAKSITLQLRDDVKFHDGTKFDADAVKFTLDTIKDPETASQGAIDIMGPYTGADVLGPNEIRINYSRPFPTVLGALADDRMSIVSPTAVKKLGNTGFAQAPVGTGPFKFVSWDKGSQVVLERNPDYNWAPEFYNNKGPSKVAKIIHRYIPNAATRVAALEAGEVTLTDLTPPLDMQRLSDGGSFKTMVGIAPGIPFGLMFNISHGPFADIAVRKAFIMSVDRGKLSKGLFFGFANASYGPLASTTPGYWKGVEAYDKFDPVAAGKLLDDAGWKMGPDKIRAKDGKPLTIDYLSMLEPDTGVAIQAAVKKVGIDFKVDTVTKARQDELVMSNQYDAGAIRWVMNDAAALRIPFHSSNIPGPGKFKFNWMHWASPDLDAMLAKAESAATIEDRAKIYQDVQKSVMDQAVFMGIHDQIETVAYSAKITGARFAPGNWQVRLYDVHAAQ
jgi:peptide/nickel transport system substrate-binding protein